MSSEQSVDGASPRETGSAAEQNPDAVMAFHRREEAKFTRTQIAIERVSDFFGSPLYFAFAIVFMAMWVGLNT